MTVVSIEAIASKPAGPMRRALGRFFSNRAALAGLVIFVPILVAVVTYPLWWPYGRNAIDLTALN